MLVVGVVVVGDVVCELVAVVVVVGVDVAVVVEVSTLPQKKNPSFSVLRFIFSWVSACKDVNDVCVCVCVTAVMWWCLGCCALCVDISSAKLPTFQSYKMIRARLVVFGWQCVLYCLSRHLSAPPRPHRIFTHLVEKQNRLDTVHDGESRKQRDRQVEVRMIVCAPVASC